MNYIPYPRLDLDNHPDLVTWRNKINKISGDWTNLKEFLADSARIDDSIHPITKCWYSEMYQGDNYALDVEHFRPKNQASPLTPKQIASIEKEFGFKYEQDISTGNYNWLEFDYRNYRIVSAITNRGGAKHIYFPIAKGTNRLTATQEPWLVSEFQYFLDPANKHDVSLLYVKPNGEIAPITPQTQLTQADFDNLPTSWQNDGFNYLRAAATIKLYRLNDKVFVKARKYVYDDIKFRLDTITILLNENPNSAIKSRLIKDLAKLLLPSAQFSLTANCALKAYITPSGTIAEISDLMTKIRNGILEEIQKQIHAMTIVWNRP